MHIDHVRTCTKPLISPSFPPAHTHVFSICLHLIFQHILRRTVQHISYVHTCDPNQHQHSLLCTCTGINCHHMCNIATNFFIFFKVPLSSWRKGVSLWILNVVPVVLDWNQICTSPLGSPFLVGIEAIAWYGGHLPVCLYACTDQVECYCHQFLKDRKFGE